MYEYGKLLIKNKDSILYKEKGYSYIQKSIEKGLNENVHSLISII